MAGVQKIYPQRFPQELVYPLIFKIYQQYYLLIVDLDVKDDGINEFQKYLDQYGNINTLIIETPSQGQHYYFNFSRARPEIKIIITNYFKNASKYKHRN